MTALVVGVLLFALALIFQSSVFANLRLLQGSSDLVLLTLIAWLLNPRLPYPGLWMLLAGLMVGWVSAMPWWAAILAYGAAGGLTLALRQRLWRTSLLLYLFLVVVGTLIVYGTTWLALFVLGTLGSWQEAFTQIILPGALINLLLALPVHSLVTEVTAWTLPEVEEP